MKTCWNSPGSVAHTVKTANQFCVYLGKLDQLGPFHEFFQWWSTYLMSIIFGIVVWIMQFCIDHLIACKHQVMKPLYFIRAYSKAELLLFRYWCTNHRTHQCSYHHTHQCSYHHTHQCNNHSTHQCNNHSTHQCNNHRTHQCNNHQKSNVAKKYCAYIAMRSYIMPPLTKIDVSNSKYKKSDEVCIRNTWSFLGEQKIFVFPNFKNEVVPPFSRQGYEYEQDLCSEKRELKTSDKQKCRIKFCVKCKISIKSWFLNPSFSNRSLLLEAEPMRSADL